jgi:hypothetical protein
VTALLIRLDAPWAECVICGEWHPVAQAIPMYEGLVLPNSWDGPWAGFDACSECFAAQEQLTEPVERWALRVVQPT